MLFCENCGEQLSAAANFCPKCGKPRHTRPSPEPQPEWETCEIIPEMVTEKWGIIPSDIMRFVARMEATKGHHTIGESKNFKAGLADYYQPDKKNKRHVEALEELVKKLVKEGWEQIDCNSAWFNPKFRRQKK
jgi:hypothetical protein